MRSEFPRRDAAWPLLLPTRGDPLWFACSRGGGPHSDVDFLVIKAEVANKAEESVRLHRTCATCACRRTSSSSATRTPTAGVRCATALSTRPSRRVGSSPAVTS